MEPSASVRKPLRARKTMTPSSRKQVAMLHRMKGLGRPGRAPSGGLSGESPSADPSGVNGDAPKDQNALLPPPATLVKPGTGLAATALEIGVGGGPREAAQELPKSPPKANTDQFLSAGALQDLLYQLYENEPSLSPPKPVEVRLNVVPASCCSSERSGEPRFPPAPAADRSPERHGSETPRDGLARVGAEQENGVSPPHQDAPGSSVLPDAAQRKKRKLESAAGALRERPEASDGAGEDGSAGRRQQNGLENVKAFVQGHLDVAVGALDRALQDVSRRLERTQCLRKHEGGVIKVLKRTSRLEKRVNAVVAVQAQLSKQMKLLGLGAPSKILNGCRPPPGPANHQPALSTTTTSGGSPASPAVDKGLASNRASPRAAESSDDVVCLEKRPPAVPPAGASGVLQDGTPGATPVPTPTPDPRKDMLVIDLTEERSLARAAGKEERTAASGKAIAASEGPEVGPPQPLLPSPKEIPWERVHLPPLPKVRLLPEEVRDFRGTAPPQKLQLTVVRLLKPKGLALQWDVRQADGRCALLDSFHVFFFLDSARAPFAWTCMKVLKALPLPMFISLGELPAAGTYYFVMLAKDVYGRYGPFSDIQAASVT